MHETRAELRLIVNADDFGEHIGFQPHRAEQRRRGPPQRVNVADLVGNRHPAVGTHLLFDEVLRENGQQRLRRNRLFGSRMQRRRQRFGKSARRLYHCLGMSACVSANWVCVLIHAKKVPNSLPPPNRLSRSY